MGILKRIFGNSEHNRPSSVGVNRYTLNTGQVTWIKSIPSHWPAIDALASVVRAGGGPLPKLYSGYEAHIEAENIYGSAQYAIGSGGHRLVIGALVWHTKPEVEVVWPNVERLFHRMKKEFPDAFHAPGGPQRPELPWMSLLAMPYLYIESDGVPELERVLNMACVLGFSIMDSIPKGKGTPYV